MEHMSSFTRVVEALQTHGSKMRVNGGKLQAQCPAHDDRTPSLAIAHLGDKTVLTCFAGCDYLDILNTLGLQPSDLFDEPLDPTPGTVVDLARYRLHHTPTPTDQHPAGTATESLEWIYTDADGNPLIKTIKTLLGDGKKTFRQYHWTGTTWQLGLGTTTPVLYNLPQVVLNAQTGGITIICEGEKDADTFNRHNTDPDMYATTAPMGAGKWRPEYTNTLQGSKEIWIIPDNDKPGIEHANKIIDQLEQAGIPWRLLTVNPNVKDLTDHINNGWTLADLTDNNQLIEQTKTEAQAKALQRAINDERIKQTARDTVKRTLANEHAADRYTLPEYRPTLRHELDIHDEPLQWVIQNLWPQDANISLTAPFKGGKTSTANSVIRALADQTPLFGHTDFTINHTGRIAIWNYEVSPNQYRQWLRDAQITNLDTITVLNMRGHTWPIIHEYVMHQTIQWLTTNNIQTWIIDPLARAFVGCGDENSNADMGIFCDTLDYIKDQAGVRNLLIIAHTGRNAEQGNSRARGASRFDDWADARWMLTKDPTGQRWFQADGRDVDIPESRLDWNNDTRHQTIQYGIGRKDEGDEEKQNKVLATLKDNPDGLTAYQIGVATKIGTLQNREPAWFQELHEGHDAPIWIIGKSERNKPIYQLKQFRNG